MEAAFGAKPTVTYYDNHVVVDNEAGKVRSKRVDLSLDGSLRLAGEGYEKNGRMTCRSAGWAGRASKFRCWATAPAPSAG